MASIPRESGRVIASRPPLISYPVERGRSPAPSLLELESLVRRRVGVQRDQPEPRLLDAGTDTVQEAQLPVRCSHDSLVRQTLDLVQQHLAALGIELAGLLHDQVVHVRIAAER